MDRAIVFSHPFVSLSSLDCLGLTLLKSSISRQEVCGRVTWKLFLSDIVIMVSGNNIGQFSVSRNRKSWSMKFKDIYFWQYFRTSDYRTISRDAFRILSKILDAAFHENVYRILAINYFCKKFHLRCFTRFWTKIKVSQNFSTFL